MASPPIYRRSLSAAFTMTLMAIVLLTAGMAGYRVGKSNWSFITATPAGGVVWSEVWAGALAALCALYFWRRGLHLLDAGDRHRL
jgi:hypothetical protein